MDTSALWVTASAGAQPQKIFHHRTKNIFMKGTYISTQLLITVRSHAGTGSDKKLAA